MSRAVGYVSRTHRIPESDLPPPMFDLMQCLKKDACKHSLPKLLAHVDKRYGAFRQFALKLQVYWADDTPANQKMSTALSLLPRTSRPSGPCLRALLWRQTSPWWFPPWTTFVWLFTAWITPLACTSSRKEWQLVRLPLSFRLRIRLT